MYICMYIFTSLTFERHEIVTNNIQYSVTKKKLYFFQNNPIWLYGPYTWGFSYFLGTFLH